MDLMMTRRQAPEHLFALKHDKQRILLLAGAIEPDQFRLHQWFCRDPIAELEACTAQELLRAGQGDRVIAFLMDILSGRRA